MAEFVRVRLSEIPIPADFDRLDMLHLIGFTMEHGGRNMRVLILDHHSFLGRGVALETCSFVTCLRAVSTSLESLGSRMV